MENDDTNVRMAKMEDQLAQLTAMMLEISQKLKEPPAVAVIGTSTPTLSGHASPSTGGTHVVDLPGKEIAGEAPSVTPVIVNLDPPSKENPTPRLSDESEKRLAKMEERLYVLQGYELKGADRLSPYTKTSFPENFQEPEFTRNLEGIALTWFIALDIEEFTSWDDLTNEFLQQYRFNTELAPTREELTRVEKKRNESFKAFAQRWRTMASQVKPALNEREMKQLFLKTLPYEYFQGLVFSGCQTFSHLVEVGEGVEWAMVEGKSSNGGAKKFPARKDMEAAIEVALVQEPHFPRPTAAPAHKPTMVPGSSSQAFDNGKRPFRKGFSPPPRPLSKLLPMLLEKRMVAKEVPRDNPPREAQPNVQQNPLPNHVGGVNSISEDTRASQQPLVLDASELYESLVLAGYYEGQKDVTLEEKVNRVRRMITMGVIRRGEEEEKVVSVIMPSSFRSSFCNFAGMSRARKAMHGISKTRRLYTRKG
ncbi:uncharacterized protein LOC120286932 [Eucalyptus grandis]|uniref:uncharacterized protein LOC120286932 n=1 Tax=Eucalyptus grandis TaxID=71139 RepID=UPI00192ED7DA|nr:uncharacterized protein LOC120286932 [Eucalyptus grandis]